MLWHFMRERLNTFILGLILSLVLAVGCSKPKTEEKEKPESAPVTETVPAAEEKAPATPEPVPAPVVPAQVEVPVEKVPEKTESIWDRFRPSSNPAVLPTSKAEPLRVYYEKDPIPESWCNAWAASGHVAVQQMQIPAGGTIPGDGDLYLFTPELLPRIVAGPGAMHLDEAWGRSGVDPVFLGHPFDTDNSLTRPWRWTPYLVYSLSARSTPWKDKFLSALWADPKAVWPSELPLLTGLSLKDAKMSANPRDQGKWLAQYRMLKAGLKDKMASEAECWKKLQAGEIELTLLPASYRLLQPADSTPALDWAIPPGGTMIYFEQLAIGEHGKQKESALSLAEYLLQTAQQKRLLADTGYFTVRTKPGNENQQAALKLGKKDWFDQSEFLTEVPPVATEETQPTGSGPAAIPPVSEAVKTDPVPVPATEKPDAPTP